MKRLPRSRYSNGRSRLVTLLPEHSGSQAKDVNGLNLNHSSSLPKRREHKVAMRACSSAAGAVNGTQSRRSRRTPLGRKSREAARDADTAQAPSKASLSSKLLVLAMLIAGFAAALVFVVSVRIG